MLKKMKNEMLKKIKIEIKWQSVIIKCVRNRVY